MTKLRVFPDTGALVAMLVFPQDRHGRLTLGGEVLQLYDEGAFDLLLSRVVVDELEEVIDRDFPEERRLLVTFVASFQDQLVRWPTPEEIRAVMPVVVDADDAPIFATALAARPDIVLSNDFQAFHSSQAKAFWRQHGIEVESLYGLLCVFGLRERRESTSTQG
jgi:predicted nucleic acid-binding protein